MYRIEYFNVRVRDTVESWPSNVAAHYARVLEMLQDMGPDLGMPHSRALGSGLFELRVKGRDGIGRTFYCYVTGRRVVILHAFLKKTQATPERHLALAKSRMKELKHAEG